MASGPFGVQLWSRMEMFCERDFELIAGRKPFPDISAAFLEVADGAADQLGGRFLGPASASGLDGLSDHTVQAFDGIAGVDDPSDGWREGKAWGHLLPGPSPVQGELSIFVTPSGFKSIQGHGGMIGGRAG